MAAVVIASNMSCRGYLRPHLNWAWLFQPPWLCPAAVYVYMAFALSWIYPTCLLHFARTSSSKMSLVVILIVASSPPVLSLRALFGFSAESLTFCIYGKHIMCLGETSVPHSTPHSVRKAHNVFGTSIRTALHTAFCIRETYNVLGTSIRTAFRTTFCIREAHTVFGTNIRTAFHTAFCIWEAYNIFGTNIRTAFRTTFCKYGKHIMFLG